MTVIEYLGEGSHDCPLVRLVTPTLLDVVSLRELAAFMSQRRESWYSLRDRDKYEIIGFSDFQLLSRDNRGLSIKGDAGYWELSPKEWAHVSLLVDALADLPEDKGGYQWLSGPNSPEPLPDTGVSVVVSRDGQW